MILTSLPTGSGAYSFATNEWLAFHLQMGANSFALDSIGLRISDPAAATSLPKIQPAGEK